MIAVRHALDGFFGGRIDHEEADESRRVPRHGRGHRRLVARHAGDERRARHAVRIELLHPAIGQRFWRARVIPLQLLAQRADGVAAPALPRQRVEELRREEMTVAIVQHDVSHA